MQVKFVFEGYLVTFSETLDYKIFDEEWHYGVNFNIDGSRYELVHNRAGLTRILINYKNGAVLDVPFNDNTIDKFLPTDIKLEKNIT